jgi:Alpha-L-fucosidase
LSSRRTFLANLLGGAAFLPSVAGPAGAQALEARNRATSNWTASKQWAPETVPVRPDGITVAMGFRGEPQGGLAHVPLEPNPDPMPSVYGFRSPRDVLTWTVEVAETATYELSILYRTTEAGSVYQLASNGTILRGTTRNTSPNSNWQLNFWREQLPGRFRLKAGKNQISLRLSQFAGRQKELAEAELAKGGQGGMTYKGNGPCSFRVWSIELVRPDARKSIEDRARRLRADGRWMVEGKYGLFIHWTPLSWPLDGLKMKYQDGANLFDVGAFADMVEETGAAWVFFTTTHQSYYFPGPNKAIDRVLPGRTCQRDLVAEIADALDKRGIRLCLYYNPAVFDPVWSRASGYSEADKARWFHNEIAIQSEINRRCGRKTWAWFVDGGYRWYYPCNFPWERFTEALKAANRSRLVAYNPGTHPSVTPFGDLLASDNGSSLRPPMPKDYTLAQYPHLLQHYSFTLERGWIITKSPHGTFPEPVHSTSTLIDYVRSSSAAGVPLTMNILITQDVTRKRPFVNPKTLEQMKALKKAIRKK